MSRHYKKYSKEFKLQCVKECEAGATFYSVDKKYGLSFGTAGNWCSNYKARGEESLEKHNSMQRQYTADFKRKVIAAYYAGEGSLDVVARKYDILSESTVLKWIRQYNNHEEGFT